MPYHLREDYVRRDPWPGVAGPAPVGVYTRAVHLARELRVGAIVDVGCAGVEHLALYRGEFQFVGVGCEETLDATPDYWQPIRSDFDAADPLPELEVPAVWVCANIIERLPEPEHLIRALGKRLGGGNIVVLATPDRVRTRGHNHVGPCPVGHAQEWALDELVAWLTEEGWAVAAATRIESNDQSPARATCLVEAA